MNQTMTAAHANAPRRLPTFLLAVALAVAGVMHWLLTPEHMAISAIFALGFLAAGMAQLGMAVLAMVRPSRLLYAAVIASTFVLSSAYAYNVLVGLPFHHEPATASIGEAKAGDGAHEEDDAHDDMASHHEAGHHADDADGNDDEMVATRGHHQEGIVLGSGEPVDTSGAATQLAQLSAATIAFMLLRRTGRRSARAPTTNLGYGATAKPSK